MVPSYRSWRCSCERAAAVVFVVASILTIVGCTSEEPIRSYAVDKVANIEPAATAAGERERMLGAIMLPGGDAWFFKLTGPVAAVTAVADDVEAVVRSVTFTNGKPQWQAPDDWVREPAGGFRYATLRIPLSGGGKPLELSVTSLPQASNDDQEYVLDNVNRWRNQLGQRPLASLIQGEGLEQFEVGGVPTTWVDIEGVSQGDAMRAPFAGGGRLPPAATPSETPRATQPPSEEAAGPLPPEINDNAALPFHKPANWTSKPGNSFSKLAFAVASQEGSAEVTVSELRGEAGGLLANVNRWRGQVNLPPVTADQLAAEAEEIEVGGEKGQLVELLGDEKGILGVIVVRPDTTLFVKLTGDTAAAAAERDNFREFSKSLKLE